jgi:MFS family permease
MILIACLLVAALTVRLAGGRLSSLADLRFRRPELLGLGLGIQVAIISVLPRGDELLHAGLHIASYLMAAAFVVANRRIPFLWLIGLGGLMNFTAIVANGGTMPASAGAMHTAGLTQEAGVFANSGALSEPRLAFLGDIFAVPASWPLHNVFSVGDICIALGGALLLHRVCGSRLVPGGAGDLAGLRSNPTFVRLWLGQAVSGIGDWIYAITVYTLAVRESHGPELFAGLLTTQLGPAVLVGIVGGPLVDRLSRKRLMLAADGARAAAVASLLLTGSPSMEHFYLVAACLGVMGALFTPSLQASLPNVLPPQQLLAANAVLSSTFTLAVTIGPLLGGLVVAQLGATPAFAFDVGSFVVSGMLIASVRFPRRAPSPTRGSPVRDLLEGGRYIARNPLLRSLLLVLGLVMFASALKVPLEPLFVLDTLSSRPEALGLVGAAWGLGMIFGAAAAPRVARRWRAERTLSVSIAAVATAVLAASQAPSLWLVLVFWILAGAGNGVGSIVHETLLQQRSDDRLRGRVLAASEAVMDGAFLAGIVIAAGLGATLGIRGAFAFAGVLLMGAAALSRALIETARPGPAPTAAGFTLEDFVRVTATPATTLLRVSGQAAGRELAGATLVIDDGIRVHRVAPLPVPAGAMFPDPAGRSRAGFPVPAPLADMPTATFDLDLGAGSRLRLPPPAHA